MVTGDLFDSTEQVKKSDVFSVVQALAGFDGRVLVLPGNHDFYTGEEKVWRHFQDALREQENRIQLLNEFREYEYEAGDEKVVVYPAFCQSKHSEGNNLCWIKEKEFRQDGTYRIGMAHGALKGITPDMNHEYFTMTEKELEDIPVDVWLIGHTHIPYPDISEGQEKTGCRIYNAGTHEQTDLHNATEGCCFLLTLENAEKKGEKRIRASKVVSGAVRFFDRILQIPAESTSDHELRDVLQSEAVEEKENAVVRFLIQGAISKEEYEMRNQIYKEVLGDYLSYEVDDSGLTTRITPEMIREEFSELSFGAKFMERLTGDAKEMQMAYELLKNCRE